MHQHPVGLQSNYLRHQRRSSNPVPFRADPPLRVCAPARPWPQHQANCYGTGHQQQNCQHPRGSSDGKEDLRQHGRYRPLLDEVTSTLNIWIRIIPAAPRLYGHSPTPKSAPADGSRVCKAASLKLCQLRSVGSLSLGFAVCSTCTCRS